MLHYTLGVRSEGLLLKAMRRTAHILWIGLLLICPVCQRGKIFNSLFEMNMRCPHCDVVFERDAGEMTGAIAITLTLLFFFIGVTAAVFSLMTDIHSAVLIAGLGILTTLLGVVSYRHAHGLWVSFLYLSGAMFEE